MSDQKRIMPEREEQANLTFLRPERFKTDPKTGADVPDAERSDEFLLFEAMGKPKVFYGIKMNKYFRDAKCEKPYFDTEVEALGLPTTKAIEEARDKLRKKNFENKVDMSLIELCRKTAPTHMDPPDEIKARLADTDYISRSIARINRSTLGKV